MLIKRYNYAGKKKPIQKNDPQKYNKKTKKNNLRRLLNNYLRKDDKLKSVTSVIDVKTQKKQKKTIC